MRSARITMTDEAIPLARRLPAHTQRESPMIKVRELTFTYPGSPLPTLKQLSFSVERGEILGFLGPSGAGKSTTQKILIGLLKEFQGDVSVFGKDLRSWRSEYYERIGVSFELPNHYLKLTALENLNYFRSLYDGETEDPNHLLDMVGLGGDGALRVSQFSKGMKNRLNFARSLLNKPELVFFDEPTTGLDPVSARRIKDIILEKKRDGRTIFLTTHDMVAATELCDRVAFMIEGEVKLIDSPRNLMLTHGARKVRVEYQVDHGVEQQEFPMEDLGRNEEFLRLLRADSVQTIHTEEATLEKVFIEVTGRSLL